MHWRIWHLKEMHSTLLLMKHKSSNRCWLSGLWVRSRLVFSTRMTTHTSHSPSSQWIHHGCPKVCSSSCVPPLANGTAVSPSRAWATAAVSYLPLSAQLTFLLCTITYRDVRKTQFWPYPCLLKTALWLPTDVVVSSVCNFRHSVLAWESTPPLSSVPCRQLCSEFAELTAFLTPASPGPRCYLWLSCPFPCPTRFTLNFHNQLMYQHLQVFSTNGKSRSQLYF